MFYNQLDQDKFSRLSESILSSQPSLGSLLSSLHHSHHEHFAH